jgi:hypothetical protein
MKTTLALVVALALNAAAQAPVVKKGSAPQPTEQHTEQAAPVVKKGTSPQQPAEQAAPVVKKGAAEQDKEAPAKKKKTKKKRSTKKSQP